MDDKDKIIHKIQKLLALAHDNSNENERLQAMTAVSDLLAKYNLDMATINAASTEIVEILDLNLKLEKWVRNIVQAVSSLYYVSILVFKHPNKPKYPIFVGTKENVDVAQRICYWLITSINTEAKNRYKDYQTKKSFKYGASIALLQQAIYLVQQEKQKAMAEMHGGVTDGTGTQLMVLRKDLQKKNEDYIADKNVNPERTRKTTTEVDFSAYASGFFYGSKLNLNKQIGDDSKKKEIEAR